MNGPGPLGIPKPLLWAVGGFLGALGIRAWWTSQSIPPAHEQNRDPDLLERLLSASSDEDVSDGQVYEDRASARAAARAYREPCRWRGLRYHYRVEPVEDGFIWSAWVTVPETEPELEEGADA